MTLDIRVLGPLEVRSGGATVALTRPRERALLTLLAVADGRPMSAGALADDLWAGAPPPTAGSALRGYLSRLRQLLGPEAVGRDGSGYRLVTEGVALDLRRFADLAAEGRARLDKGDAAGAAEAYRAALELWRGPALADVADLPAAQAAAARLEEARLVALEECLAAEVGCGHAARAAAELAELTVRHPLREGLWTLRMRALYAAGRPAEALAAYRDLRAVLVSELGVEPGPEARGLETAILRRDPALDGTGGGAAGRVPLPQRLADARPPGEYVGRVAELARIALAREAVSGGGPRRVLLVEGEPGIGKTTLCAEAARQAYAGGATVLYGRCDEGLGLPYQPFAEALRHLVAHAPDGLLQAHLARHGGDLAGLVPDFADRVADVPPPRSADPPTQRFLLFTAAVALLGATAAASPVVLVVDDLHWADEPTLALLRYLAAAPVTGLLALVTYRGADVASDSPVAAAIAALRREEGVSGVAVAGLSQSETGALATAAAGAPPPAAALARLQADTDGNPFFVIEVVRHLAEAGPGAGPVPDSVRDTVARRVARLGAEAESVLPLAGVIGREFDVEILADAAGPGAPPALPVLDRACRAHLLAELDAGRFAFVHAVVQHAVVAALGRTRLAAAHRAVADALERRHGTGPTPHAAELAAHRLAAVTRSGGPSAALPYAVWAGDAAAAALAPEEAVRWYGTALDLMDSQDPGRADLLVALGSAQLMAGQVEHRETLLAAAGLAARTGGRDALVRAALTNNRGFYTASGAIDAEKVDVLRQALQVVAQGGADRALVLATLAAELVFSDDWAERRALTDEALAIARRLRDPGCLARVMGLVYFALATPATLPERLATTAEMVELASAQADPNVRHWAHRLRLYACAEAGDLAEVDRHLPELAGAAAASGAPHNLWATAFIQGWRRLLAGDLAGAEERCEEALRLGRASGQAETEFVYGATLARIRRQQGRLGELAPLLDGTLASMGDLAVVRAEAAFAWLHAGALDRAAALLEADYATRFSLLRDDFTLSTALTTFAEVAVELGHRPAARVLYARLLPWHDQVAGVAGILMNGAIAHHLGRLALVFGDAGGAARHLDEALEIHTRLQAPYWIERTAAARAGGV